jgi:hypothetical protein
VQLIAELALLLPASPNAINASLYGKLSFNFISDIAPVAAISREPLSSGPQRQGSRIQLPSPVSAHGDQVLPAKCR